MAMKNREKLWKLFEKNPELTYTKCNLDVTEGQFYAVKREHRDQLVPHSKVTGKPVENDHPDETQLTVEMDRPLRISLRNGASLGTLRVTSKGITYAGPNARKMPEQDISWKLLTLTQEISAEK